MIFVLSSCNKNESTKKKLNLDNSNTISSEVMKDFGYSMFLNDSNPIVSIDVVDYGIMEIELFPDVAKNTVNNFLTYVENGKYTDSTFHRIISGFMIQGGQTKDNYGPISGEFDLNSFTNILSHYRGVISMARTNDFDSATSQFFIVHEDYPTLDGNYASFGGLISGFDVLDKIAEEKTDFNDSPLTDIVISKVSVELNDYTFDEVVYVN